MKILRTLHLYLGCLFAPLMLFFAASGIWQSLGIRTGTLTWLSTAHTGWMLKSGNGLGSHALRLFAVAMAGTFILSTLLGIAMALKHGRRRTAFLSLVLGVAIPLGIITRFHQHRSVRTGPPGQYTVITGLGVAAANGDTNAIDRLSALRKEIGRNVPGPERADDDRAFEGAFHSLAVSAGQGNEQAVQALLRANRIPDLQGYAVHFLTEAAGLGNQEALEPFLHPKDFAILPSSAVTALQDLTGNGNQKAIDALASWADDPGFQGNVIEGLQKPATLGANTNAINALAMIARYNGQKGDHATALLRLASSNHIDYATEMLKKIGR